MWAISYCHKFQAMFRAVITALYDTEVEVHYIDCGNCETVEYSDLRSMDRLVSAAHALFFMQFPSDDCDVHFLAKM
ncbi:unnamed protein product [Gongylonema pulchrum]|uniref:Tudor domain-containing protein n=1 Tax=Gongylonema pulchrum TaxID=637853 RepID=A0A183DXR1_9BILA|nr:unnamed protein product [Gongylonema pulchrum]